MSTISKRSLPYGFIENLLQSAVDGVICSDMKGNILIFNQAAMDICGYTEDEALNTVNIRELYPEDGAKQVMRMLRGDEYGGRGKIRSCQIDLKTKDDELVPIDLNASIIYEDGAEVATIGFFRDLRETLRMRHELEETQIQLLHAEKLSSLGKLAAGVAHQLNNPLGGIVIYAGILLEEYELGDSAREDIERILRDAKRSHSIVKELLEFARPSRHQTAIQDINKAISRTVFLLESQPIFHNVEVVKDFDEALPLVPGDRQQFSHLFMNLLLNAVEAMDGQGTLTIKTMQSEDPGFIRIVVSDTGPGIPDKIVQKVFEPFFTTKESGKGTGLGLSLVYSIVQDHAGKVSVENIKTGGASFTIEFPKGRGLQMSDKARVLVVDDELDIRDGCERVLTRAGYEVVKSDTGEKAVELFKPGAFDIVLLDLKMPGMDGMDVLERIKEIDEDVLVVIITGYATVETAVEALKMGAYDLLPKPFQIDHLRIVIGRAWDRLSLTRETAKLAEQRRKSMLDLDAEKSRLRTIVESLADGVVVTNTEGRVVLMNKPFVESVCHEPELAPGSMIEEYVDNSDLIEVVREVSDCKTQENANISRELEVRDSRHFLAEGRHIIDSDGECLGGVVTLFDITGMKMLDKLKTEFVSRITHELRSPLSTIYNQLGSVLGDISGSTMVRDRNLLSRAMERTNGLISLIGDLLDLSRIEEGSFLRQRQSVKLELFLADVVGFLQTRAEEKHQKLCLSLPTESSFEIHADPMALESVVGNLITNAIKYSSDGTSIDVALRRQGDDIVITVADNGYGIGGDDIERIFERFYRVRNEHTRDIIGTGLGLPIVKALVEEMGGEISVNSTLNEGSTFTVLLPKAALQNDPGQDKN